MHTFDQEIDNTRFVPDHFKGTESLRVFVLFVSLILFLNVTTRQKFIDHSKVHHRQPINVQTAGAQAALMDYI
jgi:hypothetical protein